LIIEKVRSIRSRELQVTAIPAGLEEHDIGPLHEVCILEPPCSSHQHDDELQEEMT